MKYIIFILIISFIIFIIKGLIFINKQTNVYKTQNDSETNDKYTIEQETKPNTTPPDEIYPYHKKLLLTKNEYFFYKRLKETISKATNTQILAKIRLADIIEVNDGLTRQEWGKYFSKIKSKHIDFAIAQDMKILMLIELDDNSHNSESREKRDEFVEKALKAANITFIRTYGDTSLIEKELYKHHVIPSITYN